MVLFNTRVRNENQSSSVSGTDTEINLSVRNPLSVIEEVMEMENFAATAEISSTEDM